MTDKKEPKPPKGAQLENKARPRAHNDERVNTADYPAGGDPRAAAGLEHR